MKRQLKLLCSVFVLIVLSVFPAWAQRSYRGGGPPSANLRDGREVRSAFRSLVADASQSTVRVVCNGTETVLGTIVSGDGFIVTKYSELKEPVTCRLADGRHFSARVVGEDPGYDLAMLKIDANELKPVEWSDDENGPAVGQLLATVSDGGELPREIGVVSVPLRRIPRPEGRLGIAFQGPDESPTISSVEFRSAAQRAGLRIGDVILRAADKSIATRQELIDLIHQHKPGDTVALVVHRGDKDVDISATLGTDQGSRSERMNAMGTNVSSRSTDFPSVIQHDTALIASDCGGPLVDLSGKVVGINIARGGRTETYAAPASRVRLLLSDLESGKLAPVDKLPSAVLVNADRPADKTAAHATVGGETPAPEHPADGEQSKGK
jgi:serine protease Do